MAIRIITRKKISIQQNITDYLGRPTFEEIDLRTSEGVQRYKEEFGCHPNSEGPNYRPRRKSRKKPPESTLRDIAYLFSIYNERDRRLFAGLLAKTIEFGGVQKTARLTSLDQKTIRRGKEELDKQVEFDPSRVRHEGSGRPTKAKADPRYELALRELIEDELAGDPMKERIWVRKTVRWMSEKLGKQGVKVSRSTVWETLKTLGISLKKNKKCKSSQSHPMRDEQFQYLNRLKCMFSDLGKPVISLDAKKKEFIGNFKSDGAVWCEKPIEVLDHDFPSLAVGKLIPFGIYDLKTNKGAVYCGISFETSEFAVDSICKWWEEYGRNQYRNETELLIICDSGGSNGYRRRRWKWALQTKLADRFELNVHICHYPPGASKYNPIERKLFSFISKNWAGEPLTSYEKALSFIRSPTTEGGLEVSATLVEREYEKGLKVTDEQMESLNIKHAKTCPRWNYCIRPR
ncbi:MAG: ISAzo13 family transposase [Candidatus Helarchaeota archaeon]